MTNTTSFVQLDGQGMDLLDILGRSGQKMEHNFYHVQSLFTLELL